MTQASMSVHAIQLPRHRLRQTAAKLLRIRRALTFQQPTTQPVIRVVCISDTHNLRPSLPPGDILIHAGDLSEWGSFEEIQTQLTWLSNQPHAHKLIIAGNHDLLFDTAFLDAHPKYKDPQARTRQDLDFGSIIYLQDESLTLSFPPHDRSLRIYGSPWTPQYGISAFQYPRQKDIWSGKKIPLATDILITHGPPAKFPLVKVSAGCPHLRDEVARIKPLLMAFGHIHVARGEQTVVFDWAQAIFDDIEDGLRGWEGVVLLLFAVLWACIGRILGRSVQGTRMVNAAVVDGMKKDVALDAFVVEV